MLSYRHVIDIDKPVVDYTSLIIRLINIDAFIFYMLKF